MDKVPKIHKENIKSLKSKVQNEFYFHRNLRNDESYEHEQQKKIKVSKKELINKINAIFLRNDYVYQADINIMYKNGENKHEKIIGFKDDFIVTLSGERIHIDEIIDID